MIENIINWIKQPWPWYVAGPLIGLMVPILLITDNKQFGVSSTFRDFCAYILPSKKIEYFNYNVREHIWRNLFVLGILVGGVFCALFLNSTSAVNISSNTVRDLTHLGFNNFKGLAPHEIYSFSGLATVKGLIFVVLGGFLVGFGTRYADGCTSGHAITGLSLLSFSSMLSVIGFFIGGLISTFLLFPIIMKL